jgi:hypothetical protein
LFCPAAVSPETATAAPEDYDKERKILLDFIIILA